MLLDDVSHGNARGGVVEERMPIVHKKAKINSLESCASKSEDPSTVEVFVAGGVKKRKRSERIPAAASYHRQEGARRENPGTVELEALLPGKPGMQINLRCRRGLEKILREEAEEQLDPSIFRPGQVRPGCVTLSPRDSVRSSRGQTKRPRDGAGVGSPGKTARLSRGILG
jgi:hypothetical protein